MGHSAAAPSDVLFRFAAFVLDPVIGRLHHDDQEIPLTKKTFCVLSVLVERHGHVVDKDDLFSQVWPDTIVEENNLARCVSMLRKALRDHDSQHEFILTVAGRGYQFSAPVEQFVRADLAVRPLSSAPQASLVPGEETRSVPATSGVMSRSRILLVAVAAVLLGVLGAASYWFIARPDRAPREIATRFRQLTSNARIEIEPAWAPDGKFVAYTSNRSGNFDLWIQPADGGRPIQVTSSEFRDSEPAWSPDGQRLAFHSGRDGGGLYVVPAFGGAAQRLTDFGHRPQWSPDGSRILFYESLRPLGNRALIVGLDGSAPQEALPAELRRFGTFHVAWHPDGQRLSILGTERSRKDRGWSFQTVSLDGGRRVFSEIAPAVAERLNRTHVQLGGFVWAPDGRSLVFEASTEHAQNLWRVTVDPKNLNWIDGPSRLTTSSSIDDDVAMAPDGHRLAFTSRTERTRGWSLAFDARTGRLKDREEPVTPDGADVLVLDVSADGKRLAYSTTRNGNQELWIRSLERPDDQLASVETHGSIGQPRWSRDGQSVAYVRAEAPGQKSGVVLVNAMTDGQRLLDGGGARTLYDWSVDGRSMLVGCQEPGKLGGICRLLLGASSTGARIQSIASDSKSSLFQARLSPNGELVSFIARTGPSRTVLYVAPASGGPWVRVTDGASYDDKPRWSPDGGVLYFLSDRSGFFNVWGARVDPETGRPIGESFQVTRFDTPERTIPEVGSLQIGLTSDRLILPLRESSGSVWILEDLP